MYNYQNYSFGLQAAIAQIRAIMTPTLTPYHQALTESVKGGSLAVQAAQLTFGAQLHAAGAGLALATTGLSFGVAASQLAEGIATPGIANLALQINPPISGFIQDAIAPELARATTLSKELRLLRKREKRNRLDFNESVLPIGKGKRKSDPGSGPDRYVLHNN